MDDERNLADDCLGAWKPHNDKKKKEAPLAPFLVQRYGPAFRGKLTRYRTAKLQGRYVALLEVDPVTLDALVRDEKGKHKNCSVNDLTDFVL
jgi:hypothetical protein